MKMVDTRCRTCGIVSEKLQRGSEPLGKCTCGSEVERIFIAHEKANNVIGDDIPGGATFKHGICWPDGTPRTFYTRHEIEQAKRKEGLVSMNESGHQIPVTTDEIDRMLSRKGYGQVPRVVTVPAVLTEADERARKEHWWMMEAKLQKDEADERARRAAMTPAERELEDRRLEASKLLLPLLR